MPNTGDQQDANTSTQQQAPLFTKLIRPILINTGIGVTVAGTTVVILNTNGSWSSIWGIVLASAGLIIGVTRLYPQRTTTVSASVTTTPLSPNTQPLNMLNEDIHIPLPNEQEGQLWVYTTKSLRGFTVDICNGFGSTTTSYAQTIAEYIIMGKKHYIAVFQSLPPGDYAVHIYRGGLMARITISPGQVGKIDWH